MWTRSAWGASPSRYSFVTGCLSNVGHSSLQRSTPNVRCSGGFAGRPLVYRARLAPLQETAQPGIPPLRRWRDSRAPRLEPSELRNLPGLRFPERSVRSFCTDYCIRSWPWLLLLAAYLGLDQCSGLLSCTSNCFGYADPTRLIDTDVE